MKQTWRPNSVRQRSSASDARRIRSSPAGGRAAAGAAVSAALALAAIAPSAAAGAVTIAKEKAVSGDVNGSNVFWITVQKRGRMFLKRRNLRTGRVTTIFKTSGEHQVLRRVRSGGNRVAWDFLTLTAVGVTSTVRYADLDGKPQFNQVSTDVRGNEDCGQVNALIDISPAGELFVASADRKRTDPACVEFENSDNFTATGYPIDGPERRLYSATLPIDDQTSANLDRIALAGEVSGNNLLFVGTRVATAVDTASLAAAGYTPRTGGEFSGGTIDGAGRMMLDELAGSRSVTSFYGDKLDPGSGTSVFDSTRSQVSTRFCGSRIVRVRYRRGASRLIVESTDTEGRKLRSFDAGRRFSIATPLKCRARKLLVVGRNSRTRRDEIRLTRVP